MSFEQSLGFVLKWEGGYTNHPNDLGGPTNHGVTQSTYDAWRRSKNLSPRSVREITLDEVREIYWASYWAPHCQDLVWPLSLVVFDTRVQFGIRGASFLIQPLIGARVDGVWGRETQGLLLDAQTKKGPRKIALEICAARIRYRISRVSTNPTQQVFLAGWINRDLALIMESALE